MILKIFRAFLTLLRPHQWTKNLFVIAPVVFSKELGEPYVVLKAIFAAVLFSLSSGAVYALNDVVDAEKDKLHPLKKFRPVASGAISTKSALMFGFFIAGLSTGLSFFFQIKFVLTLLLYFLVNIIYSFWLKKVIILDVMCIASGFLLRVIAGSYAANVKASIWILLCTYLLALFLALGKRRHEMAVNTGNLARPVLSQYSPGLIEILMKILAFLSAFSYFIYTISPHTRNYFGTNGLVFSVPFVLFGLLRFVRISTKTDSSESPTDSMIKDIPFIINLFLWFITITLLIYVF